MSDVLSERSQLPAIVERGQLYRRNDMSPSYVVLPGVADRTMASMLAKHWKYLLLVAVVALVGSAVAVQTMARLSWTYNATLLCSDSSPIPGQVAIDVATLQNMVETRPALERLKEEFKLDCSLHFLERSIDASVPYGSRSIVVMLRWSDQAEAENLLNALVNNCVEEVNHNQHALLLQQHAKCEARLESARERLATARRALADFSSKAGITEIDRDMIAVSDSISELDTAVREQRRDQHVLLTQKGKGTSMAVALMSNRSELNQLQAAQAARRKELERLKNLRHEALELTANISAALASYERAGADLHLLSQSLASPQTSLSVMHPARLSLTPPTSNERKLFVGCFLLISIVLSCPVILSELRGTKEDQILSTARKLGVPVLASGAASAHLIQKSIQFKAIDDEYARLLSLRLQQFTNSPSCVIQFSGLDGEAMPMAILHGLAECLAQRDHRVVVIILDPQCALDPALAEMLVSESEYEDDSKSQVGGLGGYLSLAHSDVDLLTTPTTIPNVDYIFPGKTPLPREGFGTQRMTELINRLRQRYSTVIIVGPDVNRPVDLELIASRVDGIVLHAFGSQGIGRGASREVLHLMELGAPVLGVIG